MDHNQLQLGDDVQKGRDKEIGASDEVADDEGVVEEGREVAYNTAEAVEQHLVAGSAEESTHQEHTSTFMWVRSPSSQ